MDCHGAGGVSQALQTNAIHGHLPQGMGDVDFEDMPPEMLADLEMQHMAEQAAWEREFSHMGHHHYDPQNMMNAELEAQMAQEWAQAHSHVEEEAMEAIFAANENAGDWLGQFQDVEGNDWAADFNQEGVQVFTCEGEPVRSYEEKLKDSKFYDFMNKVKSGEVVIEENEQSSAPQPGGEWLNEFANQGQPLDDWAAEHLEGLNGLGEDHEDFEGAWGEGEMDDAWDEAHHMDDFAAEYFGGKDGEPLVDPENWAEEYASITKQFQEAQDSTDYPFDPENPYLFHDDPFTEGQQLLAAGTVSDAVLAFEAACQKDMQQAKFWQALGTTQAENEKDQLAIKALSKARSLDPSNLLVHMSLAVSHTNEGNQNQALRALRDWIRSHPEHEAICGFMSGMDQPVDETPEDAFTRDFMFVSPSEHRDVCALYDAAIQMNPADAELHIGLGILRNLSHEYSKAAESFEHALKIRPNDAKLWNKLGATLANSNRSKEALSAYDKALDLNPGYVRAQYNMGVSYSNLGEHEMAVRQFLRAIVMQQGGVAADGEPGSNRSTREIWDVLRMTLTVMERPDLVSLAWKQDCRPFLEEFGLQDLAH